MIILQNVRISECREDRCCLPLPQPTAALFSCATDNSQSLFIH